MSDTTQTLVERLAVVQTTLDAKKTQYNKFGRYYYRSCEDIFAGLKKVLNGLVVTVSDEIVAVGDRVYVKATATISDGKDTITNTAFAREALTKKGMDESQISGTASSYARKYALNGLFLIDDVKDADTDQHRQQQQAPQPPQAKAPQTQKQYFDLRGQEQGIIHFLQSNPIEALFANIEANYFLTDDIKAQIMSLARGLQ